MYSLVTRKYCLKKILLEGQFFLIGIEVDTILDLLLNLLDKLFLFLLRQLLRSCLYLNLVTCGIGHILKLLLISDLSILLKHPISITLSLKVTRIHNPSLRTKFRNEFVVVRNDNDTSVECINGMSKSSQRFTIKVVRGFVKNDDVRLHPHGSSDDDLNLLSSGKSRHTVVGSEFWRKTTPVQVRLNILGRKGLDEHTSQLSKFEIDCLHGLLPTHLFQ
mmetsp:Transcript_21178/g.43570  ORF Transcript_21178/g.43570 Transcript_21178/m.43570 type:complete len:219 (+) Transcript_21178:47-703(+)